MPPVRTTSGSRRFRGDRVPVVVRLAGQPHVAGRVVRAADDARVVVARAPVVAEVELLEPDDRATPADSLSGPASTPPPIRARPGRRRRGRRRVGHAGSGIGQVPAASRVPPAADVEARVLHRGEQALRELPGGHAPLHALADRPVLAVDDVPELDRVGRVEAGLGDLVGVEQEVEVDRRAIRAAIGDSANDGDVVARQATEEVRVDQLALVVGPARRRRGRGTAPRASCRSS